jgi:hypothetical protein
VANGFAGVINEYDSTDGLTGGVSFEVGTGEGIEGGDGLIVDKTVKVALAAAVSFTVDSPVASGSAGQVGFESGAGFYADGSVFGRGGGVGAYLRIAPAAGCH